MAYVDVDVDVVGCSYSKLVSGRHHTTSLLEQGNDTSHSHNCVGEEELPFFSESTIHDMTCTALCCSFSQSDSHMSRRVGITVCTV